MRREKKESLCVNKKISYGQMKVAGAFHGWLSTKQTKKNSKGFKINAISLL